MKRPVLFALAASLLPAPAVAAITDVRHEPATPSPGVQEGPQPGVITRGV